MSEKINKLWNVNKDRSLSYIIEGNKIIIDTVKMMLGGGTFIFLLTGSFFGANIITLLPCLKIILIVSWSLILISFIFGIVQLYSDSNFYGRWSAAHKIAADKLAEHEKDESKAIDEAKKATDLDVHSKMTFFWIQVVMMAIAFLLQVIVLSISLFIGSSSSS